MTSLPCIIIIVTDIQVKCDFWVLFLAPTGAQEVTMFVRRSPPSYTQIATFVMSGPNFSAATFLHVDRHLILNFLQLLAFSIVSVKLRLKSRSGPCPGQGQVSALSQLSISSLTPLFQPLSAFSQLYFSFLSALFQLSLSSISGLSQLSLSSLSQLSLSALSQHSLDPLSAASQLLLSQLSLSGTISKPSLSCLLALSQLFLSSLSAH